MSNKELIRIKAKIKDSIFDLINDEFESVSEGDKFTLWLAYTSIERNQDKAISLVHDTKHHPLDKLHDVLYEINIRELCPSLNRPVISVWWKRYFFGSQLSPLAERIQSDERYDYLGLISADCIEEDTRSSINDYLFDRYLLIPDDIRLSELTFVDAVIFGESYPKRTYLPRDVIRIGQPHGLDIPMDHACVKYGGGRVFDYILCPMKEKLRPLSRYKDIFPRVLIEHSSSDVTAIPAGYTKLDKFFQASKSASVKKKIIYHISLWGVERKIYRENIGNTIRVLLENFPDRDILFRPDPTDHNNKELIQQINPWLNHPRFNISDASSYIEDYADAEVLITHRPKTAHLFSYATGRPIIRYQPGNKNSVKKTNLGYRAFGKKGLIKSVQNILKDTSSERRRIRKYMDSTLHNPGNSLDYIMKHMDVILARNKLNDWTAFPLYDPNDNSSDAENIQRCLDNGLKKGNIALNIAQAAVEYFPDNPLYKLYEAEFHSRYINPFEHVEYFQRWYTALSGVSSAIDMCEKNSDAEKRIYEWVLKKGQYMAASIKWYLSNNQHVDYGSDIDLIVEKFNKIDSKGIYLDELKQMQKLSAFDKRMVFILVKIRSFFVRVLNKLSFKP